MFYCNPIGRQGLIRPTLWVMEYCVWWVQWSWASRVVSGRSVLGKISVGATCQPNQKVFMSGSLAVGTIMICAISATAGVFGTSLQKRWFIFWQTNMKSYYANMKKSGSVIHGKPIVCAHSICAFSLCTAQTCPTSSSVNLLLLQSFVIVSSTLCCVSSAEWLPFAAYRIKPGIR